MPASYLPPGPSQSSQEQTFLWFSRPLSFLEDCYRDFGDMFTLDFHGLGKHLVVCHPDPIREVFTGAADIFRAGEGNAILRPFLGERSLLVLDGEGYRSHRQLLQPLFQTSLVQAFEPVAKKAVIKALNRWPLGEPFSFHTAALSLALDVILAYLFEEPIDGHLKEQALTALRYVGYSPVVSSTGGLAWQRFQEAVRPLEQFFHDHAGLLEDRFRYSAQDQRDELMTLLFAGHETTAAALAWATHWVLSEPGLQALIQKESESEKPSALVTSVVRESLRLSPPIPVVSRRLCQAAIIAGLEIPAGTYVVPCIYLVHRREAIYPRPHSFHPTRFLERDYGPYEYLPFGGGMRRCLGMAFALMELRVALSEIFRRFEIKRVESGETRPVRRSVVMVPSRGLHVIARPR